MSIQAGVEWHSSRHVGPFFGFVCLRRTPATKPSRAALALRDLWQRYETLRMGRLPDLPGARVPPGGLELLIGYGARAFADTDEARLAELRECAFASPDGNRHDRGVLPGSALRYAEDVTHNGADADVAVQFTAHSQTAINRAVAETHHRLLDPAAPGHGCLELSGAYLGYRRDDRRSWLGFHDGVDNIDSRERINAIKVPASADDEILRGGTYLAFLRVAIDVPTWDRQSVPVQELLIGRAKLTGAPLIVSGDEVVAAPIAPGTSDVLATANLAIREPTVVDLDHPTGLGRSHVHRARRHLSLRMFRQGYEFLETRDEPPILRTGLNFVSFQASPLPLMTALRTRSWLGGAMFGKGEGPADKPSTTLPTVLTVRAAGLFAVLATRGKDVPGLVEIWSDPGVT
jgi:hypothetical protein